MTLILVIIISLTSVIAFRVPSLFRNADLRPYMVIHDRQYHRLFTHAFLHADYLHLMINMVVLWSFGTSVERLFRNVESYEYISSANLHLAILLVVAIIGSSISTVIKYRNYQDYSSVGASGLVSAAVFTHIFFRPMDKIYFYFAIPIPGIVFGILYLVYSSYMARRNKDNINHDAHIWGAVIGFFYPLIMNPKLVEHFISSLGL